MWVAPYLAFLAIRNWGLFPTQWMDHSCMHGNSFGDNLRKKKVDCIFNFQDIMRVTTKVVAHLVGKRHKVHNKDFLLLTSIPQQKHQLIKSIPFLLFQHALMLAALYGTMQGWCFSPSLFWHSEYLGKIRRYWIILLDIKKNCCYVFVHHHFDLYMYITYLLYFQRLPHGNLFWQRSRRWGNRPVSCRKTNKIYSFSILCLNF